MGDQHIPGQKNPTNLTNPCRNEPKFTSLVDFLGCPPAAWRLNSEFSSASLPCPSLGSDFAFPTLEWEWQELGAPAWSSLLQEPGVRDELTAEGG